MKAKILPVFAIVLLLAVVTAGTAAAQQHRATRLGDPARRFAPPVNSPEELRSRFRDPKLQPDIASILQQWGWEGALPDLLHAAATAEIKELKLPPGTRMPFMSARERGKPVMLADVLWAGKEPISAYTFDFTSKGRLYRCITPRPCSNFFLEDWGAPTLALECNAPSEMPIQRPAEVCLTVRNTGDAAEPKTIISLPIPPGAAVVKMTAGGIASATNVVWEVLNLETNASKRVCASFSLKHPGSMPFTAIAAGALAKAAQASCTSRVIGLPALLIDAVDLEDPVETGREVTYDIKITNQGPTAVTNLRLECMLGDSEEYVSGSGPTPVQIKEGIIKTDPVASFASKAVVTWRVVVKALKPDDARFKVNLFADEFETPIFEEESTHLY